MNTTPVIEALSAGSRVVLTKGCRARNLSKGITCWIDSVTPLGAEYSHFVKVVVKPLNGFESGKTFIFYARHINRLSDPIVRLNDGNPIHAIQVRRAAR